MARDLIPPPSPAGRPAPDPERPRAARAARSAVPREAAGPPSRSGPSPFRTRFGFLDGRCWPAARSPPAVLLVVLHRGDVPRRGGPRPRTASAANWSPWQPTTDGDSAARRRSPSTFGADYKDAKAGRSPPSGAARSRSTFRSRVALSAAATDFAAARSTGLGVQYTLGGFGANGVLKDRTPQRGAAPAAAPRGARARAVLVPLPAGRDDGGRAAAAGAEGRADPHRTAGTHGQRRRASRRCSTAPGRPVRSSGSLRPLADRAPPDRPPGRPEAQRIDA